jgi:phosphohistidine phosphatase
MDIYFLRHGEAEDTAPDQTDAERPLTKKGRKQARKAGKWFAKNGISCEVIVSSPLLRASQTAKPIAKKLGVGMIADARLSGGLLTVTGLVQLLNEFDDPPSVLLVGHEPDFSEVIGELIGGHVEMKKAAIALVSCEQLTAGEAELRFLIPPELRG